MLVMPNESKEQELTVEDSSRPTSVLRVTKVLRDSSIAVPSSPPTRFSTNRNEKLPKVKSFLYSPQDAFIKQCE